MFFYFLFFIFNDFEHPDTHFYWLFFQYYYHLAPFANRIRLGPYWEPLRWIWCGPLNQAMATAKQFTFLGVKLVWTGCRSLMGINLSRQECVGTDRVWPLMSLSRNVRPGCQHF